VKRKAYKTKMSTVDKINLRWSDKQVEKYYNTCNGGSFRLNQSKGDNK
jgi:hypothetical protein